jgi:hypothetical protein
MNCKPGDLAIVIKADGSGIAGEISRMLVGRIVKVTHLSKPSSDFTCFANEVWKFEEPIHINFGEKKYTANGIADDCLRPIRPDETPEQSTEAMRDLTSIPNKQEQTA